MDTSKSFYAISVAALLLISGCALGRNRSPYSDRDRLVSVVRISPSGEGPALKQDLLALRSESKTLEPVVGYTLRNGVLTDGSMPERIQFAQVSMDFFPALGASPSLGRALFSEDNRPGRNNIAVISHRLWLRRFGADPNLIGSAITLDRELYTVAGVMAPEFRLPEDCDAWTPLIFDIESFRPGAKGPEMDVIARLKPGVTLDQAQADANVIASKLEVNNPQNNSGSYLKLTALRERSSQKENSEGTVLKINIDKPANLPVETGKEK